MSMFPRVEEVFPLHDKASLCECCDREADFKLKIEYSSVIGESDILKACVGHAQVAQVKRWDEFWKDYSDTLVRRGKGPSETWIDKLCLPENERRV